MQAFDDRSAAPRGTARSQRPTAHGRMSQWCRSRRIQATTRSGELQLWCTASRSLLLMWEFVSRPNELWAASTTPLPTQHAANADECAVQLRTPVSATGDLC